MSIIKKVGDEMNWVDIAVLIILTINSLVGVREGFIVTVFNLAGFIISYYIAKSYYPVVSKYIIANPDFFDKIKEFVSEKIQPLVEKNAVANDMNSMLQGIKLPKSIMEGISQNTHLDSYVKDMTDTASNLIAESLTHMLINIVSFLITFAIAWLVIMIIVKVIDSFASLPILNQFNKLLGLSVGFIKGILILYLIFAVLTPIVSFSPNGAIAKGVFDSKFGYYLYDNNILLKYLKEYWFLG